MRRMSGRFLFSVPISEVPEEVEVLHTGSFNHRVFGKFDVTKGDLESMVAEFAKTPEALIDVDHNASKGQTRAAGWVQSLRIEGEKLLAKPKWTPYGEGLVTNQEYRRVSAEFGPTRDHTGKTGPVALQAFTLTNRPFLRTLRPLTLDAGDATIVLDGMPSCDAHDMHDNQCRDCVALDSSTPGATLGSGDGADHPTNRNRSMTDTIRSVLKLADDATDEAIIAAVKALEEQKTVTLESTDVVAMTDYNAVKKLAEDAQKEAAAATAAAAAATKELAEDRRTTWITEQVRVGRITAAQVDSTILLYDASPTACIAHIEAIPVNRSLTTVLGGSAAPGTVDLSTQEGRQALQDRAEVLLAEGKAPDLGAAQIMAEKEMTA